MSTAKPFDRAQPKLNQPTPTDAKKVSVALSTTASMAQSPLWATSPDVQAAANLWSQTATNLDGNAKAIASLRLQLAAAEGKQRGLRRTYRAATRQVLSTVSIACAGSADDVKAFGFDVITRTAAGLLAAIEDVSTSGGGAQGTVTVRWPRGLARHGFLVQHATDAANPATYSALIPVTKAQYTLTGASPSGATVYFRIAAVDPHAATGQSPWSTWIAGTVR